MLAYEFGECIDFLDEITSLLAISSFKINDNIEKLSNSLKFKAEKEPDLLYWVKYILFVGTDHLSHELHDSLHPLENMDLDLHLAIYSVSLVVFLVCLAISYCCCKCCWKIFSYLFCKVH